MKVRYALIFTQDDSFCTKYCYAGDTFEIVYNFMLKTFFENMEEYLPEEISKNTWEDNGKIWEITEIKEIN